MVLGIPLLLQSVGVEGDEFLKLDIFDAQVIYEISEDPLHVTFLLVFHMIEQRAFKQHTASDSIVFHPPDILLKS